MCISRPIRSLKIASIQARLRLYLDTAQACLLHTFLCDHVLSEPDLPEGAPRQLPPDLVPPVHHQVTPPGQQVPQLQAIDFSHLMESIPFGPWDLAVCRSHVKS